MLATLGLRGWILFSRWCFGLCSLQGDDRAPHCEMSFVSPTLKLGSGVKMADRGDGIGF